MAKFVVGQPARVIADHDGGYPEIVGRETFITGGLGLYLVGEVFEEQREMLGYQVDHNSLGVKLRATEYFVCAEDELEPIIPEGLESPEAIEELYEPGPLKITVKAVSAAELYEPEDG